ncbi:MAG: 50S ribosomal protein L11 methyltransferase, partial [Clostridia bacterium]|nr:50S ribosomal protein L11 methyltransferase [Clostridia bacterium]
IGSRAVLRIDPGMAFGTGAHHTTRMCLELLEKHIKGGETVADIGCGSGILSASAMLMGASESVALDIDPVAARIAAETAEANGIDIMKYTVYTGDILTDPQIREAVTRRKYDIVLANIVANVIIALAPLVPKLMHENSVFIASGIIEDRLEEVIAALEENGLKVNEIRSGEDWRALEASLQ